VGISVGKNQWVSPKGNQWKVKGENNEKATKVFDKKSEAEEYARKIAKNQKSELIVQNKYGIIISKDSYGNDPCPPKDTEH